MELTVIYESPNPNIRRLLWGKLDIIRTVNLWLVMWDFNSALKGEERGLGAGVLSSFVNWVEQWGLIDLGIIGH